MAGADDGRIDKKTKRGQHSRGLDVGLAKSAPHAGDFSAETCKPCKRMIDLFGLQCSRRIKDKALLVLSSLRGDAWDATEGMDLRLLETEQAFAHLRECLDGWSC